MCVCLEMRSLCPSLKLKELGEIFYNLYTIFLINGQFLQKWMSHKILKLKVKSLDIK